MKRTLSLLIAVMFVLPLFSQTNEKTNNIPNILSMYKQMEDANPVVVSALERHRQYIQELWSDKQLSPKVQVDKERLDSMYVEEFDGTAFSPYYKDVYTYDQHGRPIDEIGYIEDAGSWMPDWKESFSFTSSALIEDHIIYAWSQQWDEDEMTQYEYDAADRLLVETMFFWDVNEWSPDHKIEYLYHPTTDKIDTTYHSTYIGSNNWELNYKTAHQYNAQGELEVELSLVFNISTNQFEPEMKVEYTYDAQGNIISAISSNYDVYSSTWEYFFKEELVYDTYGNITEFIIFMYNPANSLWEPFIKVEYSYGANHNITEQMMSMYNTTGSIWIPMFKMEFQHDYTVSGSDLILPYTLAVEAGEFFTHMLNEIISYEYDFATTSWIEEERIILFYSEQTVSGIDEVSQTNFNVFPNPAKSHIHVQTKDQFSNGTFELFDIQGRKIIDRPIDGNSTISIDHIKSGIYFYRISDKISIIQNGRIVKE